MYNLPTKEPNSHKGEKGKVLVVGGSNQYYGAPIITALAVEKSGADLITMYLPEQYINTARNYSLNFFLKSFVQGDLGLKDIGLIIEECKNHHALVIGNGLGKETDTHKAIQMILTELLIPVVIDADALIPQILNIPKKSTWVLTPHKDEFKRLFGVEASPKTTQEKAKQYNVIILVKGHIDYVASPDKIEQNTTGCPQMRVGGTGDALAGIIASYIAQGLNPYEAARSACYYYGKVGELIATKQVSFTAKDLILSYPELLYSLL